ncbi:MAG: anhydro-N-acetylmuramic acid kinase [Saprospiraceae bacterium]
MSGTSMDGLDIAYCKITGSGFDTQCELLHFETIPYSEVVKEKISLVFPKKEVSLEDFSLMNAWLGTYHALLILDFLKKNGLSKEDVDLIASHGQTIFHAPKSMHQRQDFPNATLQIGDADHLAVKTGIITLSDFRQKNIAGGGEGAPLAFYGDALLFHSEKENRILLNIGGIANFTYLPSRELEKALVTDTGPGNTLIDAYVKKHFGKSYDENGLIAQSGNVDSKLLETLKYHPFFKIKPPKSTGQEIFNLGWLKSKLKEIGFEIKCEDVVATLTRFSAETIFDTIQSTINTSESVMIYLSGGGIHNPVLLSHLKDLFKNVKIQSIQVLGMNPDAKEAMLFAVLANQTLMDDAFPLPGYPT